MVMDDSIINTILFGILSFLTLATWHLFAHPVTVKLKSVILRFYYYLANPHPTSTPEFLKSLSDKQVSPGRNVKFRCKIRGYPQPRIIWKKDGKRIVQSQEQLKYIIGKF